MSEGVQPAVVFPGQGSQLVGMLGELYQSKPQVREAFEQASDALHEDLWALIEKGPQETLNLTKNAQPALLTASVAIWRVLQAQLDIQASAMAGHSLGEWSALVCSGALEFSDAVRLVRARGEFMQQAVPLGQGAMAAVIGLEDTQIEQICADATQGEICAAVNYNSPGQVVIAGHAQAIDRAGELCREAGAKRVLPLAVSAPFHTALMKPAAEQLAQQLESISMEVPSTPVVHNVHGRTVDSVAALKSVVIEQIYAPVRWVDCVRTMTTQFGAEHFIECGPGKVLCGLIKRIDKSTKQHASDSEAALEKLREQFA